VLSRIPLVSEMYSDGIQSDICVKMPRQGDERNLNLPSQPGFSKKGNWEQVIGMHIVAYDNINKYNCKK
jgi:hypothetical protein